MDHLVYAAPDLDEAVARVESLLGVEAVPGGRHPGVGTRNALISFGGERYLEIVAPDPDQEDPDRPRWFGIDELREPRLVTWCARTHDLEALVARAAAAGVDLGAVSAGGRRRPDGSELRWMVSDPRAERDGGVLPFFIDWLDSPHPGEEEGRCNFVSLRAWHPRPAQVARRLAALGLDMEVEEDTEARLQAVIRTPAGLVELG